VQCVYRERMNKQHPTETIDLPDQHDHEAEEACDALAATDLPDAVIDALAVDADAADRCAAWSLTIYLGLAGGDGWVRDALLAGADLTGGVL
jgi:hypothetical protein